MLNLLVIGLFANSAFLAAKADIVVKPRDTEAVIGDSTYFDCESNVNTNEVNWYHYAVGTKDHEDVCLYCLGRVHLRYEGRIEVGRNDSTNNYQLRIKTVQRDDAGTYICEDNGGIGESASAQLIILESSPNCTSNMKPDGALGPNDCGLESDALQLSCHVSYHGNIPPVINWRKAETIDPVNQSICQNIDNLITCNLSMTVDLGQNGASYICETNRSKTQYNCASDILRVIYVKIDNSTEKSTQGDDDKVFCFVNSSLSCSHVWKWFDGVHEEVVTHGSPLTAQKPGWHKCEADCNIRGKQCTVLSKLVHVSEPIGLSVPEVIAISLVSILAVELVIVVICICLRKSAVSQRFRRKRDQTLLNDESEKPANKILPSNIVTTKVAREKRSLIRGMTILGNEIFVVSQRWSEIDVFDCNTLDSIRQWTLEELIRPSDISSCKGNMCLYIMDWKGGSMKKEVLCVDPNGTLLRKWNTGDDYGNSVFVTNEMNIIVTCLGKNEFNEYSPEGNLLRKISLKGSDAPMYAIKITSGDFMVSSGDSHHVHRVCLVDPNGRVKKSFGEEKGSILEHVVNPLRLAVFADGSVAVLDNGHQRVLLLDKDLKFKGVLLSEKINNLQNPTRILLDETSGRLFVADRQKNAGAILVFQLKEILQNFFEM